MIALWKRQNSDNRFLGGEVTVTFSDVEKKLLFQQLALFCPIGVQAASADCA